MADLSDLTASVFDVATYEPQRPNNFVLSFGTTNLTALPWLQSLADACESFDIPETTVETESVDYARNTRKHPRWQSVGDANAVFFDLVDLTDPAYPKGAFYAITKWVDLVRSIRRSTEPVTVGFEESFKLDFQIVFYLPDGTVERAVNLWGVFPSSFTPPRANHSEESISVFNVVFSVDDVTYINYGEDDPEV